MNKQLEQKGIEKRFKIPEFSLIKNEIFVIESKTKINGIKYYKKEEDINDEVSVRKFIYFIRITKWRLPF